MNRIPQVIIPFLGIYIATSYLVDAPTALLTTLFLVAMVALAKTTISIWAKYQGYHTAGSRAGFWAILGTGTISAAALWHTGSAQLLLWAVGAAVSLGTVIFRAASK